MIGLPDAKILPAMLGKKMQVGLVAADLDATLEYWTASLGVGPFVVIEDGIGGRKVTHRGERSAVEVSIAFSYIGETQIEIIKQNNRAPSPYQEFLDAGREGLHHLAFWPQDFNDAALELERRGFSEAYVIYAGDDTKTAIYYDTPAHLGFMVEITPWNAERAAYFGRIKALANNWNGDRPVRKFKTRADFLASKD